MQIAVCLKAVDPRPQVEALTGTVTTDQRRAGASDADQAALEWALRCGEAWGAPVLAVSAGDAGDAVLRDALAAGVHRAVWLPAAPDGPTDAAAAAVAAVVAGADAVWCGDVSLDRGSGAFPAFLAAHLGASQALGLVEVELGEPGVVHAVRRLDGGRRERLVVQRPFVCSVEGAAARLRRAGLPAVLTAAETLVERGPEVVAEARPGTTRPYRPRARVLAAPSGSTARDRIVRLTTGATGGGSGSLPVELPATEAADRILAALTAWGEIADPTHPVTATVPDGDGAR